MKTRFACLSAYAIAMALLEAVVVVYLRALLDISGSRVALGPRVTIEMEAGREAATLVMLVAVGWLAGRNWRERCAYGLYTFGLWDIFYYVWLKVLTGWPETVFNWDVLFLIPVRWWGPVLAPCLIAALLCLSAVLAVARLQRQPRIGFTRTRIAVTTGGALLALYVFMLDSLSALMLGRVDWDTLRPAPFQWPLFLVALAMMAWGSLRAAWPLSRFTVPTEDSSSAHRSSAAAPRRS